MPPSGHPEEEENPFDVADDWAELESAPGGASVPGLDDDDLDWGAEDEGTEAGMLQSVTTDAQSHTADTMLGEASTCIASRSSGGGGSSQAPEELTPCLEDSPAVPLPVPDPTVPVTNPIQPQQQLQQAPLDGIQQASVPITATEAFQEEKQELEQQETPAVLVQRDIGTEGSVALNRVVEAPDHGVPNPPPASTEIESDEDQDSKQKPEQQEPVHATQGKGWGWGGFKALGQIGKLAAEAVRDVKELTGSLQQALATVEDDSDEDDTQQVKPSSDNSKSDQPALTGEPVKATDATATRAAPGPVVDASAAPVQQAIDRDEQVSDGEKEDTQDFVEQEVDELTTGAVKAFSSLWGGISAAASKTVNLVSKVEAATVGIAKDLVSSSGVSQDVAQLQAAAASSVRGMAMNVTRIGTRIEAGLETVGRTAMELLEEVTGQHGSRMSEGDDEWEGEPGAMRTFEELLELYGGRQLKEELENLGNECARIANRARSKLEAGQQAELDSQLAVLGPMFSATLASGSGGSNSSSSAGGGQQPGLLEGVAPAAAKEQLAARYVPIRFLCQDSISRANAFQAVLVGAIKGLHTAPATTPAPATTTGTATSKSPKADEAAAAASGGSVDHDAWDVEEEEGHQAGKEEQEAEGPASVRDILHQLLAYADKRLAELVAAQLQLMLDHGVSLAAPARLVEVQGGSSITWPDSARQQAALLQQQATQMAGDVQAVSAAFYVTVATALKELLPATPPPPGASAAAPKAGAVVEVDSKQQSDVADGGQGGDEAVNSQEAGSKVAGDEFRIDQLQEVCEKVMAQLQNARQGAQGHLEGGLRSLLYPVLVRALVQHIAGPAPTSVPPIP